MQPLVKAVEDLFSCFILLRKHWRLEEGGDRVDHVVRRHLHGVRDLPDVTAAEDVLEAEHRRFVHDLPLKISADIWAHKRILLAGLMQRDTELGQQLVVSLFTLLLV